MPPDVRKAFGLPQKCVGKISRLRRSLGRSPNLGGSTEAQSASAHQTAEPQRSASPARQSTPEACLRKSGFDSFERLEWLVTQHGRFDYIGRCTDGNDHAGSFDLG
jgi:hypothetical protein